MNLLINIKKRQVIRLGLNLRKFAGGHRSRACPARQMAALARTVSPSRGKDKKEITRSQSPPLPVADREPGVKELSKIAGQSDMSEMPVNWMDVLKDTRQKDDTPLPKKIIDFRADPKHESHSDPLQRRAATIGPATSRAMSPVVHENASLARSSPLQGEVLARGYRAPQQYDVVLLQRTRLESSGAIYVDMPSPFDLPPVNPSLSNLMLNLRSSPTMTDIFGSQTKRRGPEDVRSHYSAYSDVLAGVKGVAFSDYYWPRGGGPCIPRGHGSRPRRESRLCMYFFCSQCPH